MFLIGKEKLIGHAFGVPLGVAVLCALMCQNVKSFASDNNEVAVHIITEPPVIIPQEVKKFAPKLPKTNKEKQVETPKYHPTTQKLALSNTDYTPVPLAIDTPITTNIEPISEKISYALPINTTQPKQEANKQLGGELAIYCPTRPPPNYPPASREMGEEGVVTLKVIIAHDGSIENAKIIESSKYQRLDNAALTAVRRWHCKSPFGADENIKAVALQEFEFGINH